MIRFLHSSDWHLGKPFGQFEERLRGELHAARSGIVRRVAAAARAGGAPLVLVAGDIFDAETPPDRVLMQALDALAAERDIRWALLPGNHDPARPGGLWERVAVSRPDNVLLLTEPEPVEAAPGLRLLPAPLRSKDPGRDLTAWMDAAATPEGAARIGVAHGPVRAFGEESPHSAVIDPSRAERAGLGYLALGDWHGMRRIAPRVWYSGTPEPDRFGAGESGLCLSVALEGPQAVPQVEPVAVAAHAWVEATIPVRPGADPAEALARCLPPGARRSAVLLSVRLEGRASVAERAAWLAEAASLEPRLAHLALDAAALELAHEPADLDRLGQGGALREAAEALAAEAADAARPAEERRAARDALGLLYSWAVEDGAPEDGAAAPGAGAGR